jgi:hypothetical protein
MWDALLAPDTMRTITTSRRRRAERLVAALFLRATALAAQPEPSVDTARVTLPPLHLESIAFDVARNRVVLFGGARELTGTLEWTDATGWRRVVDSVSSPPPRSGAPMAYDPGRRRVVMFGGQARRAPNVPSKLCDTWTFDGRWSLESEGPCPTDFTINSSLVYDTRREVMLFIDGTTVGRDTLLRPTRIWRWTTSGWALVDSTGPRRRGFSSVAFDASRGVLVVPVLFGGPDAGTWEWDGRRWRHASTTGPSTRQTYGLAYDDKQRRTILMGGQATTRGPYLDDAWSWDGTRWTELPRPIGAMPGGRGGLNLIRDPNADRFLHFGGYDETGPRTDFWILERRRWRIWGPD